MSTAPRPNPLSVVPAPKPAGAGSSPVAKAATPGAAAVHAATVHAGTAPRGKAAPAPDLKLVGSAAPATPSVVAPERARVMSIRWIVTFTAVALTAAAVLSVGAVSERNARAALTTEIETRLLVQARNLALTSSGALLGDYPELTLEPLVKELTGRRAELAYAIVVDHSNVIQAHPDARLLGSPYAQPKDLVPATGAPPLEPSESLLQNGRVLVASAPVPHISGRSIGTAIVAVPRGYIDRLLAESRGQQAMVLALFVLLASAAAFFVVSQLLRPVGALRAGIERIAGGDLDTPIALEDRTELGLLANAMNHMASALKKAQATLVERERLAHEVDLARQIQNSLLPAGPVTTGDYEICGAQRPAAEVGGDYYDILPLPDGRIGIAVADVSGKGLAGCLVTSMLSALLRAFRTTHLSPTEMLAALDERLAESLRPGMFVTMFYGVFDPARGELVYASAGHNPMLVYREGAASLERFGTRGIPLGAIRGGAIRRTLQDDRVALGPGDLLVQFTDGINEAFDRSGKEQFGFDRLESAVLAAAPAGPQAVLEQVRRDVGAWTAGTPPHDDETLLLIGRKRVSVRPGQAPVASADTGAAEALLADARRDGIRLEIAPGADPLEPIRGWTAELPSIAPLPAPDRELLCSALYELANNIREHGHAARDGRSFEIWWLPPVSLLAGRGATAATASARPPAPWGTFIVRDDGPTFPLERWQPSDFNDPAVRARGRGFGLDIIHRVMIETEYVPASRHGNLWVLSFGPRPATGETRS